MAMYYLEDFVESIEGLSEFIGANLKRMGDADEKAAREEELAEREVKRYFLSGQTMNGEQRAAKCHRIRTSFAKAQQVHQKKLSVLDQVHEIIERHSKRLDNEVKKFTNELEAENPGITNTLVEKANKAGQKHASVEQLTSRKSVTDYAETSSEVSGLTSRSRKDSVSSRKETKKADGPARKKQKKQSISAASGVSAAGLGAGLRDTSLGLVGTVLAGLDMGTTGIPEPAGGLDPNEPKYCLCNQVSYGDMVGCDNPDCPIEWFHYGCVGLTEAPKGKWYCPQCR
eukprot:Clim_evm242s157 gene=Clim_evmTU242s157